MVDVLPDNAAAGLLVGQNEAHVLIREDATAEQIADALTEVLGGWFGTAWLHIGSTDEAAESLT